MKQTAFKILTASQWKQFRDDGMFHGAPVDLADGYIHMSSAEQVQGTLERHFRGQSGLVLAEIDLEAIADIVRWDVSRGGALFPHAYGSLPIEAVLSHREIETT